MTISEKIKHALDIDGVAILPPMDAENCLRVNMTTLSQDY